MKREELKQAALKYFGLHGYEGTSLAQIAEEAGIKKSSIYAHFKGKDELFLEVLREAKKVEISLKETYFQQNNTRNADDFLYGYLVHTKEMFQKNESLKFWLRMGFFPPAHLYQEVHKDVMEVEILQEMLLKKAFKQWIQQDALTAEENEETLTIAYTGMIMAIMVELVYFHTSNRVEEKLEALWRIFWQGIKRR
ncbi:TetR/AcrR family transcriptional regulator [Niallia sp. 01092]|uniref:TetR/AcrR family transcriptional regulator n=1 Tax=unclassified Niallia TaxID=2837522 RepID=UPI003FD3138E